MRAVSIKIYDLPEEEEQSLLDLIHSMGWNYSVRHYTKTKRKKRVFTKDEIIRIFRLAEGGNGACTIARFLGPDVLAGSVQMVIDLHGDLYRRIAAEVGYQRHRGR